MQAHPALKALPVEIWDMIFQFSCTDDGYTGQSLSQVSRFFHVLSAPYKFQSVSLRNLKFIFRFHQAFKDKPPHLRRIRYLCISNDGDLFATEYGVHSNWDRDGCFSFSYYDQDISGGYGSDFEDTEQDTPSPKSESSSDFEEENAEHASLTDAEMAELDEEVDFLKSAEGEEHLPEGCPIQGCLLPEGDDGMTYFDRRFMDTVHAILELCSSTLWVLSVSIDAIVSLAQVVPLLPEVPMPCLQELVWGVPIHFWPSYGPPRPEPLQPHFPALERLHIISTDRRIYLEAIALHSSPFVMQHCPRLQYLRSRIEADKFVDAITEAQMTGQPINFDAPPNIMEYIVDLHCNSAIPAIGRQLLQRGLSDEDVRRMMDPRIKLAVLRKMEASFVENDWLERISGKLGGWKWSATRFNDPLWNLEDSVRDACCEGMENHQY
ncbi:hypothetical protein BDN72DRAFT_847776 [Pluteus cervinus]|uniref:Uncharacterized protein n=1 Tax=Pluteus cervinus TaxID=181527 RepID=A0ACD3AEH3_9AGAR|nr:hypothetical protein BDN72DRAFT_847776 [Pluteus cervinus]